jgi:2-oxoglutarate/2-oxoacid ferredoxin oxidoreductase subunit alpha
MRRSLTIGIAGAGGDGVVVLGSLLQQLAALQGYFSQMPKFYGAQIRGGGSAVKLSLDAEGSSLPKDSLDILVCFDWGKYLEFRHELPTRADTLVLYENAPPEEIGLPEKSYKIDFSNVSKQATGAPRSKNIVALGLLNRILALKEDRIKTAIDNNPELKLLTKTLPALEAGGHLLADISFTELKLHPVHSALPKVIIDGNTAVAKAAIRVGSRAFFGYPITPASEIMDKMQDELARGKGAFLQAEDEIASVSLAIGASLTGAKSFTSTSGPGFALMTEGMVLASSSEIPLVIVDVQRCGPSTGIPSKSEQSDLNHAIYGGHGDAPRVVIAPYDVEGCYRLLIESVNIAQYYQTLAIFLSDQWLGQTPVATNDDFLKVKYAIQELKKPAGDDLKDYRRYKLTKDGISPMAVAGDEGLMYQTSGLSHNEKGRPAFDFETNQKMHEKRWHKLAPLCQRDDLVKVFEKQESTRGIIAWGSSAQVVLDTIKELGLENKVKLCIPELIYPLPEKVERFIKASQKLLVIEMNYSGQLYHYLRSQIDLPSNTKTYNRAGGKPFSRKELTEPIMELIR